MKKIVFTILLFSSFSLLEASPFYGGVALRSAVPHDNVPSTDFNYNIGVNGSIFAGYARCDGLRVELEGNAHYNKIDSVTINGNPTLLHGHLHLYSVMVNLLYHGFEKWTVRPYYGGGCGWGWENADLSQIKESESNFCCQAIFGLTYPLPCQMEASVEYRFFYFNQEIETHSFGLALKRFF